MDDSKRFLPHHICTICLLREEGILYKYDEAKNVYYHPLHDKGYIGEFAKGFFGYNSNPNYVELAAWLLSLMFGLNLWRRFYS